MLPIRRQAASAAGFLLRLCGFLYNPQYLFRVCRPEQGAKE
ncbi:hypothetical protein HMPREF9120_02881 [Neisseria sp. oral taxon 020 str. F0370]|nr:hypothetical protein HMPREF9120_02881 [Neisseria sp. oral taxon 020 str. F0370]